MSKIISFPHMGNYFIPIEFLCKHLTNCQITISPPITKKTLELGSKYSPEFVCIPFKYNLGNYIEALENGANVLIQAGGGCRYGYYAEVQQQILKDLGYDFEFYSLINNDIPAPINIYKTLKKINKKLSIFKYLYYIILTLLMIYFMDRIDIKIRSNIGFELEENSFNNLIDSLLKDLKNTRGYIHLIYIYIRILILF